MTRKNKFDQAQYSSKKRMNLKALTLIEREEKVREFLEKRYNVSIFQFLKYHESKGTKLSGICYKLQCIGITKEEAVLLCKKHKIRVNEEINVGLVLGYNARKKTSKMDGIAKALSKREFHFFYKHPPIYFPYHK